MTLFRGAAMLNELRTVTCRVRAGHRQVEWKIRDMLDACDRILTRTAGLSKATYDTDIDRQFGFTHLVQIVGEAASHVSNEERDRHSEIPWKQIIGTRHRIVHDYVNVDTDILCGIITTHIPRLHESLQQIRPTDENDVQPERADASDRKLISAGCVRMQASTDRNSCRRRPTPGGSRISGTVHRRPPSAVTCARKKILHRGVSLAH